MTLSQQSKGFTMARLIGLIQEVHFTGRTPKKKESKRRLPY